jgi:hypothetical protein
LDATAELYPLLDMHGQHVEYVDYTEIRRLKTLGVVSAFGTKKKTHGYRLTVSLSRVAGYEYSDRSLVPANYAGTRYVFREKISSPTVNAHIYRLKRLNELESPEHGLLRILTPVALEAATYTPRSQATEAELATDPSSETKRRVRKIFMLGRVAPRTAQPSNVIPFPTKPVPVVAPLLAA